MPSKDEVAERLAQAHYIVEPGITRIYRLVKDAAEEADPEEPIKLLEVNEETLPLGIRPVYFGPHAPSGVSYPSAIVEITLEEFERLGRGELGLPAGWNLGGSIDRHSEVRERAT